MLSAKEIDAVQQLAGELERRRGHRPEEPVTSGPNIAAFPADSQEAKDLAWSQENLRFKNGEPVLDIANALRVFERHEVFSGRFRYNETLTKVMDKGAVMLEWRVSEVVAVMQERFLPGISPEDVSKALLVYANRAILKD